MTKKAFTLIELIIVIGIISTIAAFVFVDFSSAKKAQALQNGVYEFNALIQQSRSNVQAGKVKDWVHVCEGAEFSSGNTFAKIDGFLNIETGVCEKTQSEKYGIASDEIFIKNIFVNESQVSGEFLIWFYPPDAKIVIMQNGVTLDADLKIEFAHKSELKKTIFYELSV